MKLNKVRELLENCVSLNHKTRIQEVKLMITGLNHVTLAITDLEKSIDFYVNILGGKLRVRWKKGAYLEFGSLWLALNLDKVMTRDEGNFVNHIAFSVDKEDFKEFKKTLIENDINEYQENKSEGNSYYFKDPSGNNLEIHVGNLDNRLEWIRANNRFDYEVYD